MKNSKIFISSLLLCASLVACGGDGGPPAGLVAPPEGQGIQLSIGVHLGAGDETEYCRYAVLPGAEALNVSRVEHAYSPGSHHLIVYQTGLSAADVANQTEPFACAGVGFTELGVTGILYAAQRFPRASSPIPRAWPIRLPLATWCCSTPTILTPATKLSTLRYA